MSSKLSKKEKRKQAAIKQAKAQTFDYLKPDLDSQIRTFGMENQKELVYNQVIESLGINLIPSTIEIAQETKKQIPYYFYKFIYEFFAFCSGDIVGIIIDYVSSELSSTIEHVCLPHDLPDIVPNVDELKDLNEDILIKLRTGRIFRAAEEQKTREYLVLREGRIFKLFKIENKIIPYSLLVPEMDKNYLAKLKSNRYEIIGSEEKYNSPYKTLVSDIYNITGLDITGRMILEFRPELFLIVYRSDDKRNAENLCQTDISLDPKKIEGKYPFCLYKCKYLTVKLIDKFGVVVFSEVEIKKMCITIGKITMI